MNKKIVKSFNINCNWYADYFDATGKGTGSWNGEIVLYDDNSVVGLAKDKGAENTTHILLGAFVPNAGLSICKFNINNQRYDPIFFDGLINSNGDKNTYYGDVSSVTPLNMYHVGNASLNIVEKEKSNKDIADLLLNYQTSVFHIEMESNFQISLINSIQQQNNSDIAFKLEALKEELQTKPLPKCFDAELKK